MRRGLRSRRSRFVAGFVASVALAVVLGFRPVIEYADLTCPAGTVVQYQSIADWSAYCAPAEGAPGPTSVPIQRYLGLFLTNVDVRVFDLDFDTFHGPALGVRLGR